MDITRSSHSGVVTLAVSGRIDSAWAGHLDTAIAEVVREGHDRLQLDLSATTFLSSAGVGVLMKHYKELARINGSLTVSQMSDVVHTVLDLTNLTDAFVRPAGAASPAAPATAPGIERKSAEGTRIERDGTRWEIFSVAPDAALSCRTIGNDAGLGAPSGDGHVVLCHGSLVMVGIGGIGTSVAECRDRFGDLLAVSGAIVYQPSDASNVPDYLIGGRSNSGAMQAIPNARVLYGLACEGTFASLARFESTTATGGTGLATLARTCLEVSGAPAAGVVIVAEIAGLVGAALRQSPAVAVAGGSTDGFFAHPGIRERLTFTAERAFARNVALVVGVVAASDAPAIHSSQLRPLDGASDVIGHFHAAAVPFRPFMKGRLELGDTVASLFESERVLGVLHLLYDGRPGGAGMSEFVRGACWTAPIRSWV